MWEIDETPAESVQTALSFFQERNSNEEIEKDSEVKSLQKQLEEKESSCKQVLLKLDHYQKTSEELSTLLKNSDFKKEFYINECQEANIRLNELESKIKEMANQLSDNEMTQKQLSHAASELMSTQGQLLSKEAEIAELKRAKVESTIQIEAMESFLSQEKLKAEEILRHTSELNETIMHLKLKALEVENEKAKVVSEKEAKLEIAENTVAEAQKQLEIMHALENQLWEKSAFIDSLQLELKKENELHIWSEKVASNAISELGQLKADMELQGRKNLDQAAYISLLETELEKLQMELGKSEEEVCHLNTNVENLKSELEKIRAEMVETREKENEAQVEIALLKSELQNERSKLAAAEVSEARSKSETSALFNTLQPLALEHEEAKKENQELKKAQKLADESKSNNIVELPEENHTQYGELSEADEEQKIYEERKDGTDVHETLIKKNASLHENVQEFEVLKKELEVALSKIGEFRIRAEQAISRAEVAENAKTALEEEIKRRRERKERRKAAITALHEESNSGDTSTTNGLKHDDAVKNDRSLSKILNIKF
ncbi:putative leucine-rich repeat-containing protein [Forsythia ovata]|uniref:Leucine-rich repeat-containing protein n=1 Tax=Forsythia ovata TaxID=205694 RepID=A0ABD1TU47_9LAMI